MKTIVITGAGGVLCAGFSEHLAAKGNRIALLDLNEAAAQAVADRINAAGGIAKAYKCNVLDRESIESVHERVVADLGKCDILINAAPPRTRNTPRATKMPQTRPPSSISRKRGSISSLTSISKAFCSPARCS